MNEKIIAIVGSNNKESQTCRLIELWFQRMAALDHTVRCEAVVLRDVHVAMCEGCGGCSKGEACGLDQGDDMSFLREKMRDCDVIVFSSPVYHQNMSGIMKNFIDRMAGAAPSFTGKLGFTLTTTSSSGGKLVSDMLWQVQSRLGIKNIDNFVFRAACDDALAASELWAKAAVEDMKYQAELRRQVLAARK